MPAETRTTVAVPRPDEAERTALRTFLTAQRESVLEILAGLSRRQLCSSVLPSGWTPLGMLEHLGRMERFWFQVVVTGSGGPLPWDDDATADGTFRSTQPVASVVAFYQEQRRISDEVLATTSLDARPVVTDLPPALAALAVDVRTVALHVLEETARHAGHLDTARELVDGRVGLGPR